MTAVLHVDPVAPEPSLITRAAQCLRDGGLVAFPTETVYGLGVHALDREAVRRLYAAKGRPAADPLIVHVSALADVPRLVSAIPAAVERLARRFWPGPLTLVMPRSAEVPNEVTAGLETVAIRIPVHPVAQALIREAGIPVAAPSANLFSRPSPTQAAHVLEDLDGKIDLVVDGGSTTIGVESTVLDLTGNVPVILRPGGVTFDDLRELLPDVRVHTVASTGPMRSPGLLEKHYSPRAPLTLYTGDGERPLQRLVSDLGKLTRASDSRIGVLIASDERPQVPEQPWIVVADRGPSDRPDIAAARLYAALRELDQAGVEQILATDVSIRGGLGDALRDRLSRAAAGRVVVVGVRS